MKSAFRSPFLPRESSTPWSGLEQLQSTCLGMILLPIEDLFSQEKNFLTSHEKERIKKMGLLRKKSFMASRAALKRLARQLGLVKENRPDRTIETLGPDNVRPCLADSRLYCSVSHSGSMVVAVAHRHPLGVDLESISEKALRALQVFRIAKEQELISFSPLGPERAATRIWTSKEAAAKAMGLHLFQALREIEGVSLGELEGLIRYRGKTYPVRYGEGDGQVISLLACDDL
jgi:phosphopantetheinyl transferase